MIIFVKILIFSKFMVKIGGVRRGRNWFKKTKIFLFFETSGMCTIPPQVSLAYHYHLKSYGMCMLKLLKRHHLFCFFLRGASPLPRCTLGLPTGTWGQILGQWKRLMHHSSLYENFVK